MATRVSDHELVAKYSAYFEQALKKFFGARKRCCYSMQWVLYRAAGEFVSAFAMGLLGIFF